MIGWSNKRDGKKGVKYMEEIQLRMEQMIFPTIFDGSFTSVLACVSCVESKHFHRPVRHQHMLCSVS